MSFRAQLVVLILIALATTGGFLYYSADFLVGRVISILPPATAAATYATIHILVFEQLTVLMIFMIAIAIACFVILGSLIAKPLHMMVRAMKAFAKDGTHLPVPELFGTPSEIHELATVFSEFTDRVEAAHQKDEDISRVKSDFISTAAHQFRTPLTGIRWALEALQKEPLTEDQMLLVKNATDKSHDLVAIVATLLDISSIESGKFKYAFVVTDIEPLVSQVAKDFTLLAQKNSVTLYYAKEADTIPEVRIDAERIKWVLNNLVENAIRYTPAGGHVRLTVGTVPGRVLVRVTDTGIGIDAKDRANIFERFYRAGNAIAKENQGNGLGLYIARTIATDHGGDLNFAANTGGTGTTFTLSLPVPA
jgi:signal transduction histidine kinase